MICQANSSVVLSYCSQNTLRLRSSIYFGDVRQARIRTVKLFLGLDLGISTAKAVLFYGNGQQIAGSKDDYLIIPQGDTVEADPEVYWVPISRVIRELCRNGAAIHLIFGRSRSPVIPKQLSRWMQMEHQCDLRSPGWTIAPGRRPPNWGARLAERGFCR
jgi:hypothetical protein